MLKQDTSQDGIQAALKYWKYFGLWPPESIYKYFYWIYSFLIHLSFSYVYGLTMVVGVFGVNDLKDSTEIMYIALSDICYVYKISILWFRLKRIKQLQISIKNDLIILDENDPEEQRLIINGIKRSKSIFNLVAGMFMLATIFGTFKALLSGGKVLPYPGWYPFDWKMSNSRFGLLLFLQTFGMSMQVIISAGIDTFPSSVMIRLGGYCDALGYHMEKIGWHGGTEEEYKKDDEKFRKVVQNYTNISKILSSVEEIFSEMMFGQFCCGGIVVCTTAFQMSLMPIRENLSKFGFFVSYLFAMLAQIYIPCHYGNEITLKSSQLTTNIYNSNWMKLTMKSRKRIILLMEFLKNPLKVKGAGLFYLDLSTFKSIMNFAYSVYTLLHRIQTKSSNLKEI